MHRFGGRLRGGDQEPEICGRFSRLWDCTSQAGSFLEAWREKVKLFMLLRSKAGIVLGRRFAAARRRRGYLLSILINISRRLGEVQFYSANRITYQITPGSG